MLHDPNQTQSERNAFENLILLCPKHHKIIDDKPKTFTVKKLMKKDHESVIRIKDVIQLTDKMVDEMVKKLE